MTWFARRAELWKCSQDDIVATSSSGAATLLLPHLAAADPGFSSRRVTCFSKFLPLMDRKETFMNSRSQLSTVFLCSFAGPVLLTAVFMSGCSGSDAGANHETPTGGGGTTSVAGGTTSVEGGTTSEAGGTTTVAGGTTSPGGGTTVAGGTKTGGGKSAGGKRGC